MSAAESNMLPLGTRAFNFMLYDSVNSKITSLDEIRSEKATVIAFICNHCPYVKNILPEFCKLTEEYIPRGVRFAAISPNDIEKYPEDSPERMRTLAIENNFGFPYLYDETQETARLYNAACTPEFYVFDKDLLLVYRGQFDDSRPGNEITPSGADLREALENILAGKPVSVIQKASIGCSIKWK
ncbi:MAG: thioredoxin family protein [Bacteroidota bacterium]